MLLVLPAGKPLAHAGEAPHGATVTPLAAGAAVGPPLAVLLAQPEQLDVGVDLHAADAGLQLLRVGRCTRSH